MTERTVLELLQGLWTVRKSIIIPEHFYTPRIEYLPLQNPVNGLRDNLMGAAVTTIRPGKTLCTTLEHTFVYFYPSKAKKSGSNVARTLCSRTGRA